ncbi:metal-dependent transcriptional regulator [Salinibacterium sp. SYSU T00001]|uniref:metal-dependent transcriptional regulator n=1 Tax=Homoserinimonas sedimenticola TaxID=2986805 RepID=UPI002235DF7D|nr:metal-dependent transcriptional regulator [Salinibacterium sedimenticola]MCW4386579.1 metal-dependent transcriptional regulator [Salinibacterium sedimenticola]
MSPALPSTTVVEDYVKTIYSFSEWTDTPATPSALAASTVTEMVKKLAASGLVDHVPYGAITLTADGRALALRMVRRHRLIETWLAHSFGYRWDEVHDEAEVLEHAVSDRMLDAIFEQLGRPTRDPHGDPIPSADGRVEIPPAVLLADAPDGHAGRVVRIRDRDANLLRYLTAEGFAVDARVTVVGRKPFGGALAITLEGAELDVGDEAAREIWLSA